MSFADSIRTCFSKYATFSGRARRSEFWWFSLFLVIVYIIIAVLDAAMKTSIPVVIFFLAIIVPSIAVTWRRLHDTGRSGGWFFISLVPLVGGIVLLVFECMDSQPSTNQYGSSPKALGRPNPGAYGDPYTNPQGAA